MPLSVSLSPSLLFASSLIHSLTSSAVVSAKTRSATAGTASWKSLDWCTLTRMKYPCCGLDRLPMLLLLLLLLLLLPAVMFLVPLLLPWPEGASRPPLPPGRGALPGRLLDTAGGGACALETMLLISYGAGRCCCSSRGDLCRGRQVRLM